MSSNGKVVLDLLGSIQEDEIALVYKKPDGQPLIVVMARDSVSIDPNTKYEVLEFKS